MKAPWRRAGSALLVLGFALQLGGVAQAQIEVMVGNDSGHVDTLPDLTLSWLNGQKQPVRALTRKGPILLNFWATWCAPCLEEMPDLARFERENARLGLRVIAVNVNEKTDRSKVRRVKRAQKIRFPVLLDSEWRLVSALKRGTAFPLSVLIGADGQILGTEVGPITRATSLAWHDLLVGQEQALDQK